MRLTLICAIALLIAIFNGSPSSCAQAGLLNLPVGEGAPFQGKIPLTDALGHLGGLVSGGFVLFGSEVILKDGKEPTVALEIKPGLDLGSALHIVLDQIGGYGMEVVSDHLVNVYPSRFRGDPADVLNLRVPSFNLVNTRAGAILAGPERFIPELKDRLTLPLEPGKQRLDLYVLGINQSGPAVMLQLHDTTVRQILNAVSKATEGYGPPDIPLGWAYLSGPDPNSNVPVRSWKPLYSLPRDWRARSKNAQGTPK